MSNKKIGFDRTIRIEWLDVIVARILSGDSEEAVRKFIWNFLEDVEPGTTNNSGRGKTLTVLTRIWISVPKEAESLKRAALNEISGASAEERVGIHWAMVAATHPFFFDVAMHVGKLIRLNGSANRTQIKRRMTAAWGDRSTLERTIQHVLKTLAQWGLIRSGKEYGSLEGPIQRIRISEKVSQILCHAVLLGEGNGMIVPQLVDHSALFPFALELGPRQLLSNPEFRVQRQGDQSDFIELSQALSSG